MLPQYWVDDEEVTKAQYVQAERANGFYNNIGQPDEPATSSWSKRMHDGTERQGRITYGPRE